VSSKTNHWDVAILGGGFAAQMLARQLTRTVAGLRIGIFEKRTDFDYKVGEATVEIGANYIVRRLGLQRYLYDRHYPKNGLRYFFDTPERNAPLQALSEIGPVNLPFHPAFQINRATIEEDLDRMNRDAGVHVRRGVRVRVSATDVRDDGGEHTFAVEPLSADVADATRVDLAETHTARWVVDASGRAELLARAKGLRLREEEQCVGSVWGRFEDVVDIDDIGPAEFHERNRHSVRGLSTMHFWYDGYWIWFIPLRGGATSVGVVGAPVAERPEIRTLEGFRAFLEEHAAIATLLDGARGVDVGSYTQIAYGTKTFFHAGRWGLTGEAASAADPLYSPGTDFIALENDFLTDLIRRDRAGESAVELAERTRLYEEFMQFRQEATLMLYRGLYPTFGSYELTRVKWELDIASYFNLWVTAYMLDQHLETAWLRRQLRLRPMVLTALAGFADLMRETADVLRREERFYARNLGEFSFGLENIDLIPSVGLKRSRKEVLAKQEEIFNTVRRQLIALRDGEHSAMALERLPLSAFVAGSALG
jgi:flavin-dependent dehydrogenase